MARTRWSCSQSPLTFIIIILSVWFPANSVQIVKNSLFFSAVTSFSYASLFLAFLFVLRRFPTARPRPPPFFLISPAL